MIDADLPGRNSFHPRPLLPCNLGRWAPLPVAITREPGYEIEGYVEPFFINLSNIPTVFLSSSFSGGLSGIFTEGGEGRSEILLGANAKRSVKLFGLCERVLGLGCKFGFSFLQVNLFCTGYIPC